ncbi:hypothetical protein LCGC14_2749620, partial [marine sediment metagenome]
MFSSRRMFGNNKHTILHLYFYFCYCSNIISFTSFGWFFYTIIGISKGKVQESIIGVFSKQRTDREVSYSIKQVPRNSRCKGVGPYIITENSHTIEKKSKTPFYFAFGEFAATLPLEYARIVQYLRDSGKRITNIEDLADLAGMKFDETNKVWEKIPENKLTEEQKKKIDEINIAITPYKTINISNLAYMFPFNITPALMESKTQHMIGLKMSMFNKMNMQ